MNNSIIYQKGNAIISPLGSHSNDNFSALINGRSQLHLHQNRLDIPEPFFASMFEDGEIEALFAEKNRPSANSNPLSRFEQVAVLAAQQAIENAHIDATQNDVLFILSSTKGDIDLLAAPHYQHKVLLQNALHINQALKMANEPMVVSNACTSGAAAQLLAFNLLKFRPQYKHVIVVGAELLSKFIVSGFQSFKALSSECCRPFDQKRCGLNLGEAAAAIVYSRAQSADDVPAESVVLRAGAINNDANHISGPSRTGEGLLLSINKALENTDKQQLAFINAHGTSTLYNDDMESVAIQRAGLQAVPVNSLKAYFGHTLGAAGVLETILSGMALQRRRVLVTRNCSQPGTAAAINVCQQVQETNGNAFLKLMSGFGGVNAALLLSLNQQ